MENNLYKKAQNILNDIAVRIKRREEGYGADYTKASWGNALESYYEQLLARNNVTWLAYDSATEEEKEKLNKESILIDKIQRELEKNNPYLRSWYKSQPFLIH